MCVCIYIYILVEIHYETRFSTEVLLSPPSGTPLREDRIEKSKRGMWNYPSSHHHARSVFTAISTSFPEISRSFHIGIIWSNLQTSAELFDPELPSFPSTDQTTPWRLLLFSSFGPIGNPHGTKRENPTCVIPSSKPYGYSNTALLLRAKERKNRMKKKIK